ncbi:uncharacterized protein [Nicotiana tomentosiformis]|uniref:uncharacterized protein n=1 Tax=Nicotiana tomentosiformis TaxID=4098 RepID=UPI00388C7CF1
MPKYDGTSDPQEHITTYTTAVKGNDLASPEIESVFLKKFGETLTKGSLTWYSLLPKHSIYSFEMITNSFIKAHAGTRKVPVQKADIFRIAQGESELLREFVSRFQKERMLLPVMPDEWAAEETTWADVHNRYESKIRIEDDQLGFLTSTKGRYREKNKEKLKDDFDVDRRSPKGQFLPYERVKRCGRGFRSANRFTTDRRVDRGRNNRSLKDKEISSSRDSTYPRLSEYNFNVSIVELVSAMRSIKEAQFLRPMRSSSSQRDPNIMCEYHGTNGHQTGDCRYLHEEVATLLKNGHLIEFLNGCTKNNYGRNRDNAEPSMT